MVGYLSDGDQSVIKSPGKFLTTSGDEIVPGVSMLAAPGHTPGHACVAFSSGYDQLLFVGGLFYFPEEIADPDWFAYFDYDPAQAIATRRRIFTAAARDKMLMMGFHLPFPGAGYITEVGRGWTWTDAGSCADGKG